jgi:hypothetical protein
MAQDIVLATLSGSILIIVCGFAFCMDIRQSRQRKPADLAE